VRVSTLRRLGRVLYLAWRNVRRSRARLFLLTLLTTVGLLIFLFMYGLSDASGRQLETAIDENLGVEGTYRISVQNDLLTATDDVVDTVVAALGPEDPLALVAYGQVTVEPAGCAGTSADGLIIAYEVRSPEQLVSQASAPRRGADADGPACIAGIVLPPAGLSPLAPLMQRVLELDEQPLVVEAAVSPSIELSVGEPEALVVIVNFQGSGDRVDALRTGITNALAPMAARSGLTEDWLEGISIQRVDEGASVRAAEQGVKLVYQVIGWGVLGLGSLAILVAQLMTTQNRTWFFGLARVWGARRSDLALLAIAEVGLLVVLSLCLTLVLSIVIDPSLSSWSRANFDVEISLADASVLPVLLGGALLLAAVGAGYPAYRASRVDPLEALES